MNTDPFHKVHEICGGDYATRELRAGISKFVEEQVKHCMGMNNPRWLDRALRSPDWARTELQMCNAAKAEGVRCMQVFVAPWCENLARTRADESEDGIAKIRFTMSKKWTDTKEVGSLAVRNFITKQRSRSTRPLGHHFPRPPKIAHTRNAQRKEVAHVR